MSIEHDEKIKLFGTDHSPWTQAVVLSAVAQGRAVQLQPYPPTIDCFFQYGLVMPVCRWSEGSTTSDSLSILMRLHGVVSEATETELRKDQAEFEKLFLCYVLDRASSGRWWAFIQAWSRKLDAPHTVLSVTLRSLLCWYFVLVLWFGRLQMHSMGGSPKAPERVQKRLSVWEQRLQVAPFLCGEEPGASDYGLLGQLECMASGPTDWTLPIVGEFPQIMAWLERMHARVSHHPVVHSRRFRDAEIVPKRATDFESSWFCLTFILWPVLLWKIVLPLLVLAFILRFKNPNRSGARLRVRGR